VPRDGRETAARLLGIAVALAVMTAAWQVIRWPAPAISVTLGFGAYLLARETRQR